METDFFRNKRVTVMGLGLLGRGVGDAAYIAEAGAADVLATDLKDERALATSVAQLEQYPNVHFRLGEHRFEDFAERDLILVAAGVPIDSPYLAHAQEQGIRLAQSAALFAELSSIPVIGVTGTRGKSTVTHLIHHVLEMATGQSVILGGNVRGVSNLQLLANVREDSLAVMELDSWQLQGWGWATCSPQVAVFTSFMPDHMNYYHGDMHAYLADKANIFRFQDETGTLVTTPAVFAWLQELPDKLAQEVVLTDSSELPDDVLLPMPGEHNRQNAALALAALRTTGLPDEEIFEHFASFPGVPGRLQFLGSNQAGVRVYNDNNATTPEAAAAGVRAVAGERDVILIAGGSDKELDLAPLLAAIEQHCRLVVLTPGSGTDRLRPLLRGLTTHVEVVEVADVAAATVAAVAAAQPGETILFSPAFASFSLFNNEYERHEAFEQAVRGQLAEGE